MTVYYSVKNTAKNGQLIRADRRDYILTLLLIYGGYHILHNPNVPDEMKQDFYNDFYPDNKLRQKQFSILFFPVDKLKVKYYNNDYGNFLTYLSKVAEREFNYSNNVFNNYEYEFFFDTRKLRAYLDRLEWGVGKKWRFQRTLTFLWSPALFVRFLTDFNHISTSQDQRYSCICINHYFFWGIAYDPKEAAEFVKSYFHKIGINYNIEIWYSDLDVPKDQVYTKDTIRIFYESGYITIPTPVFKELKARADKELISIKQKLYNAGYFEDEEDIDLSNINTDFRSQGIKEKTREAWLKRNVKTKKKKSPKPLKSA